MIGHTIIAETSVREIADAKTNASTIRIDLDDYQSSNHS
jgi:hypothetical protein